MPCHHAESTTYALSVHTDCYQTLRYASIRNVVEKLSSGRRGTGINRFEPIRVVEEKSLDMVVVGKHNSNMEWIDGGSRVILDAGEYGHLVQSSQDALSRAAEMVKEAGEKAAKAEELLAESLKSDLAQKRIDDLVSAIEIRDADRERMVRIAEDMMREVYLTMSRSYSREHRTELEQKMHELRKRNYGGFWK